MHSHVWVNYYESCRQRKGIVARVPHFFKDSGVVKSSLGILWLDKVCEDSPCRYQGLQLATWFAEQVQNIVTCITESKINASKILWLEVGDADHDELYDIEETVR
jgi:hypothetical protein